MTFVGSPEEADANAFHFPPLHPACAEAALAVYPRSASRCSGRRPVRTEWALVVTGGFELVRPASRAGRHAGGLHANSVTERRTVSAG